MTAAVGRPGDGRQWLVRSGTRRTVFLAAAALYAVVVVPIGIHKGSDFDLHVGQAARLLELSPLYTSDLNLGVWWPPLAVLAFTPFALLGQLSPAVAKGAYALASVACLAWSLRQIPATAGWALLLTLAAVAVPLQTNFEYLNINAVLLALCIAAGADLAAGRDTRAGAWIGLATALKLFPGLLLLYAAYRGRWRTVAVGGAIAFVGTVAAMLPYGPEGAFAQLADWITRTAEGGWVAHRGNQSFAALLLRLGTPSGAVVAGQVAVVGVAAWALRRPGDPWREVAVVLLLAVLLSPIAWSHAYLLLLPAWWVASDRQTGAKGVTLTRVSLGSAALLTSGLLTIWSRPLKLALLDLSLYTWGALILLTVLLVGAARSHARSVGPQYTAL